MKNLMTKFQLYQFGMKLSFLMIFLFSEVLKGGTVVPTGNFLQQIKPGLIPNLESRYPFSFYYGDIPSGKLLAEWPCKQTTEKLDQNRIKETITWKLPDNRRGSYE